MGRRVPSHNQALRFDARKRPFDPLAAAEHIHAIFTECPGADKPHLLARIKGIVADVDPMWGGFRFPPITWKEETTGVGEEFNPPAPLDPWPPKPKPIPVTQPESPASPAPPQPTDLETDTPICVSQKLQVDL